MVFQVFVRAVAEDGVVEANPVDQGQRAEAGEAADVGRALAIGGLLHHHARQFGQGLRQGAHQLFFQVLLVQHFDLQRHGMGIKACARGCDDDLR